MIEVAEPDSRETQSMDSVTTCPATAESDATTVTAAAALMFISASFSLDAANVVAVEAARTSDLAIVFLEVTKDIHPADTIRPTDLTEVAVVPHETMTDFVAVFA